MPAHVIRLNWGSFRRLIKVWAYSVVQREAVGITEDGTIGCWPLSELEAIDAERRFVDLDMALRKAAGTVIDPWQ